MSEIDRLIRHQAEMVKKEERKKDELNIIKDSMEDDNLPDVKIENISDGYYEVLIEVDKISQEMKDLLSLSIISDLKYHRMKDKSVVMKGTLKYNPMSVATTLKPDLRVTDEEAK